MSEPLSPSAKSQGEALIRDAFDRARQAGKLEWHRMTTAVLKNRILQSTDGQLGLLHG